MSRQVEPALVVGVPVGFVGAAAAKDELRASGLPSLSNVSEKGGSAVAVAASTPCSGWPGATPKRPRCPRRRPTPRDAAAAATGRARHP
jgi:Precorrin isomerase